MTQHGNPISSGYHQLDDQNINTKWEYNRQIGVVHLNSNQGFYEQICSFLSKFVFTHFFKSQYLQNFWLSFTKTESEANPNNNLMMRRACLSRLYASCICWAVDNIHNSSQTFASVNCLLNEVDHIQSDASANLFYFI